MWVYLLHLCLLKSDPSEGGLTDIAPEVLHLILSCLVHGKHNLGVGDDQKTAFLNKLKEGMFD